MNKVTELEKVIEKVHDGMTIGIGGFLGVGAPLKAIEAIAAKGVKDLTVVSVVSAYPGGGFDLAPLFKNNQVKKFIGAHTGTCPEAMEVYKRGDMEVEFYPMGTWVEKLRAAGGGLGGVLTPVGVGTLMETGKEKLTINGKEYLLELPLKLDISFIKGYRADAIGNVQYRMSGGNSNPYLAMAAGFTVAEVNEIVEIGQIEPVRVGTPGIFVKAVVQGNSFEDHKKIYTDLWTRTGQLK